MLVRLLVAAALLGICAAPAAAQEPLPGTSWVLPRDGSSHPASSWPDATAFEMVEFTIYVDVYEAGAHPFDVEVSGSPALDADGTLADAGRIDGYVAAPRAAAPEVFSARTSVAAQWLSIPATYYWQAHYDEDGEVYATPVQRLTITPRPAPDPPAVPAPPPLPLLQPPTVAAPATVPAPLAATTMRTIVRRAIIRVTGRAPHGLLYRCVSVTAGAAKCRPSWRDARYVYRGTLEIRSGLVGAGVTFTGTRTARSCVRRCARAFEWSTSL
jgi:hypothetical protein